MWAWAFVAWGQATPTVSGTFAVDEPEATVAARHSAAVETGLLGLPMPFRPFARAPLTRAVFDCGTVALSLRPEAFTSQCDTKKPFAHAIDPPGPKSHVNDDGDTVTVAFSVANGAPTVRFTTSQGGKALEYVPQADGGLLIRTEIFSDRLSAPIRWATRYRRVD